jgi:hypothetical protein
MTTTGMMMKMTTTTRATMASREFKNTSRRDGT